MDPFALRAAFRVAALIVIVAALMLPFQKPTSAEFVVTVLAGVVGLIFVAVVAIVVRLSAPRPPNSRRVDRVPSMSSNVRNEGPGRDK
jgi:amino acid transporter